MSQSRRTTVFFYGLFMDADLLRAKGIVATNIRQALVEDFSLVIGRRAALVPAKGARSYGMLMDLSHDELAALYCGADLQCYKPEAVLAQTFDSKLVAALCYNLPEAPAVDERNSAYADQLRAVLKQLGFPERYADSIQESNFGAKMN